MNIEDNGWNSKRFERIWWTNTRQLSVFFYHILTHYCKHMNIHPPEHKESSDEAPWFPKIWLLVFILDPSIFYILLSSLQSYCYILPFLSFLFLSLSYFLFHFSPFFSVSAALRPSLSAFTNPYFWSGWCIGHDIAVFQYLSVESVF